MKKNNVISLLTILLFFLCGCFLFSSNLKAQVSEGGTPFSFGNSKLKTDIPTVELPALDWQSLEVEDKQDRLDNVPPRFGYAVPVNANLKQAGIWTDLSNGDRIWRLAIYCQDATSININYQRFWLPKGGRFFLYDEAKTMVLGAFTEKNHKPSGRFATGIIPTDRLILEYYEPAAVKGQGIIELATVVHGYKLGHLYAANYQKDFGTSGSCNINVNCSDGDNWQTTKKAVALITLSNNTRWCTGTLLNNVEEDLKPYFLTAHHCVEGMGGAGDEFDWIFIFGYESSTCPHPGTDGPLNESVQGAILRATHPGTDDEIGSDFALFELLEDPKDYDVYYAGWSREDVSFTDVVGIHHPDGDVKKISFDNNETFIEGYAFGEMGFPGSTHHRVNWNNGTTEPGSSGSALFNSDQLVIGNLAGGLAACGNSGNNGEPDWYGRVAYAWDQSGQDASVRLQNWLDPNNTGAMTLAGKSPSGAENSIMVTHNRRCDFPSVGLATVTVVVSGGTPPYTAAGSFGTENNLAAGESFTFTLEAEETAYNIDITDAEGAMRLIIATDLTPCVKLPVELLSFTGEAQAIGNALKWATASETNNDFYTLYHALDQQDFAPIAKIAGVQTDYTTNAYQFLHKNTAKGTHYYQLKQTDTDGMVRTSAVLSLQRGERNMGFDFDRVTHVSGEVLVQFSHPSATKLMANMYDLQGKNVLQEQINTTTTGQTDWKVTTTTLPAGVYLLSLTDGKEVITRKIMIN